MARSRTREVESVPAFAFETRSCITQVRSVTRHGQISSLEATFRTVLGRCCTKLCLTLWRSMVLLVSQLPCREATIRPSEVKDRRRTGGERMTTGCDAKKKMRLGAERHSRDLQQLDLLQGCHPRPATCQESRRPFRPVHLFGCFPIPSRGGERKCMAPTHTQRALYPRKLDRDRTTAPHGGGRMGGPRKPGRFPRRLPHGRCIL